ncbi:NADPH-dependent F420 reductase [Candidatus Borrarchaeum sp.]|uniref:NADPH-dependent F420 reductase n=1 Tax=Candidatus Borrarchaeum sp. TaxID=2846742 RepID=UPI00257E2CF6|nr:NADPH-dependent F420 reductase [Candidatus Borrarchaeum sp.]
MKIGILGTGNVGRALAKPWAEKGHEIVFGSRDPNKALEIAESMGKNVCSSTYEEAAQWAEVVVLAVPYTAALDVLRDAGDLTGKILVDCTNPIAPGLSGLLIGLTTSAAEEIAKMTSAKVVKAFNTMGVGVMANVQFGSETASNFICGDDEAKSVVRSLGEDIGFDVIDIGPLSNARLLEPLAMLWIYLAFKHGMGTDIAFKLLRR